MKKFAQKHKADVPGWIWLTGKKEDIEHILKKLGQWSPDVEAHSTQLIAWNFNTDKGRKMLPNVPPESIAAQIKLLASDESLLPGLGQRAQGKLMSPSLIQACRVRHAHRSWVWIGAHGAPYACSPCERARAGAESVALGSA